MSVSFLGWLALIGGLLVLFAIDLLFAHRGGASLRRAAAWSTLWMVVAVAFGLVVLAAADGAAAGAYWAGFLMEKALSLDNVFVIAVLMGTFAVPRDKKADVLTFGIILALVLRTVFIVAGIALIELFHPVLYAMGALLVATGIRLGVKGDAAEDAANSRPMRLVRRIGAPPLLAALLAVAVADVVFAVDSIPAVLAITTDTFLVFAANAFALLGLRALYMLLEGAAARFHYLHYGLAALLVFVGAKMLLEDIIHLPIAISLGAIVVILGASIGASLAHRPVPQEA